MNGSEQTTTCATDADKAHWTFPVTLHKPCYSSTYITSTDCVLCTIVFDMCIAAMQRHRWSISEPIPAAISILILVQLDSTSSGPRPVWPWSLSLACLWAGCCPSLCWCFLHLRSWQSCCSAACPELCPSFPSWPWQGAQHSLRKGCFWLNCIKFLCTEGRVNE